MFASRNPAIPLFHHEIGAAEQVIGFGVIGRAADLLFQTLSRFIHVPCREKFFACGVSMHREHKQRKEQQRQKDCRLHSYGACGLSEVVLPELLRDHLNGGAIGKRLVLGRQGHQVSLGKARGNLDASQILQGKLNRLALQVVVDDAENIRLGLIDAESVALQGERTAMLRDHDGHADVDVRQQAQIFIVDDAGCLADISGAA